MKILVLNHSAPDRDLGQYLAVPGDVIVSRGPVDPSEPLDPAVAADADGIINSSAVSDIGPTQTYPACRIVVRMGVGYDNLDLAAWGARGVPVCNVPDYGTTEVADHAIALMLALTRGTAFFAHRIAADPVANWDSAAAPLVRRLRGGVFGIIGLGRIGLATALRVRGFDMQIAFYDPYVPNGIELAMGVRRMHSVAELMAISDVVSVHAPLTPETRHIIGAEALSHARPGLIVVNTARGPLVDIDALHDALRAGQIGGAGLDVLPEEPPDLARPLIRALVDDAPYTRGRLIVTPHAAFFSPDGVVDLRRKSVEVIEAYLTEGRLMNCVNREWLKL